MGDYTELILGARLKKDTPKNVIETLRFMIGDAERPEALAFETSSGRCPLRSCSYYFAVTEPITKMYYDDIAKCWILSSRASIKNHEYEIDAFLDWMKPFIEKGSGLRNMYAIKIYEEDEEPTVYYLED